MILKTWGNDVSDKFFVKYSRCGNNKPCKVQERYRIPVYGIKIIGGKRIKL
jgi:hypothetical protein